MVNVFGRIAPGFSLQDAQSEVAAVGERMAVAFPDTHKQIRPQVQSYTHTFIGTEGPEAELTVVHSVRRLLLLLIVAVNVSVLVYIPARPHGPVRLQCEPRLERAEAGSLRSCSWRRSCQQSLRRRSASALSASPSAGSAGRLRTRQTASIMD